MTANIVEVMARAAWEERRRHCREANGFYLEEYDEVFNEVRVSAINNVKGEQAVALKALEAAGYVLMPKEPTEAMVWRAATVLDRPSLYMGGPSKGNQRNAKEVYAALVQAAKEGA